MRIQFASDFHLEFVENFNYLQALNIDAAGDVLVLAGDVFVMSKESSEFEQFCDWCSTNFKHTFIVPGNHEYYGGKDIESTITDWELPLRHNVKVMNNRSVVIGGVEFFFTTLWARVEPANEEIVNKYMPECSLAMYKGRSFKANDYTEVHERCMQWLNGALVASTAAHKVVVTHHCPVPVEDPRYESNGLSSAFVNQMEDYVAACGADAWMFGHTHYNGARGMQLGNTVLCTNQLGYVTKGVCDGFIGSPVIEV